MCPREKGFVLWGHCQNLLDDPRIRYDLRMYQAGENGHTVVSLTRQDNNCLESARHVTFI